MSRWDEAKIRGPGSDSGASLAARQRPDARRDVGWLGTATACSFGSEGRRCSLRRSVLLDADAWQPAEAGGQPPVCLAQQLHRRRDEDAADDGSVQQDRDAEA